MTNKKFNLEDYEPVEERLARFHEDYPTARVITEMPEYSEDRVVFKAFLYKDYGDEKPTATGYAEETRGEGFVNQTSHLENCETSAIGRALANAGYAPKGARPSREEMEKVARQTTKTTAKDKQDTAEDKQGQIKRLYAIVAKSGSKNVSNDVTKMAVKKGYGAIGGMPVEEIQALADALEKKLNK